MINAEVFHRLLQQPSLLNECTEADLEMLAYQYPWFGAAQLLLAAKQKQSGAVDAEQQLQKAAIYFNQPLWLQQQWKNFTKSNATGERTDEPSLPINEVITAASVSIDEQDASLDADALVVAEDLKEEQQAVITDAVLNAEAILEAEAIKEEQEAVIADAVIDAEVLVQAEAEKEAAAVIQAADIELAAEAVIEADTAREELTEAAQQPQKTEQEPVFTFEPFHTVDYFASQGIKLREEKLGDDQLGKQVKSFTQWLRSMKKIYVEEQKELDSTQEKEVVSIATESNQQTEVITETMAEVLLKQGKRSQAIDLYRKLSLLHPEKSVYFASRIDELKQ